MTTTLAIGVLLTFTVRPIGDDVQLWAHLHFENERGSVPVQLSKHQVLGNRWIPAWEGDKYAWHDGQSFWIKCASGRYVGYIGPCHYPARPERRWTAVIDLPPGATLDVDTRMDISYALPDDATACIATYQTLIRDKHGKEYMLESDPAPFLWPGNPAKKKKPPKVGLAPWPAEPTSISPRPARLLDLDAVRAAQGKATGAMPLKRDPATGLNVETLRIATIVRKQKPPGRAPEP